MGEPPPPPEKPRLEYRNYSDDRPERGKHIRSFIHGLVIGIVFIGLGGFVTLFGTLEEMNTTTRPSGRSPIVAVFGGLAAAAGIGGFFVLRGIRRRFWHGGFLIGIALTCLLEGICFSG